MAAIDIHLFPCLSDNYGMLVHDPVSGRTASIDTPDGEEIARQCSLKEWQLTEIWNTHWHPDHTGGNMLLKDRFGVHIYGPGKIDGRIPGIDSRLGDGDRFDFGDHVVRVMETPGHTLEHIVFYLEAASACFVGDTLFTLGCGKLFEGTPEQMWDSFEKILGLPQATKLYCAHEYTLSNARFAQSVDGGLPALEQAVARYAAMRERGEPTVPTTVAMERATNPFWLAGSADELGRRRALKDAM
ncbi:hydroxyacylglutathione hydrolase [Algimonas porphyrae]|uniref:Hydroxyacylglutathione hydrolase n=1 Tax=Algimonas porphyrae TaxID=1128113 RepID=A0ABQ5V3G7_9PROT|nr:hydroxyacylglutathione hydrolase [Algimonas porphyrae]GLQ22051.1 hydroxyacylglutathione hydrolase [Algimonas porphyrae]